MRPPSPVRSTTRAHPPSRFHLNRSRIVGMTNLRKALPYLLLACAALMALPLAAQPDCSFTFTFTGASTQTAVSNLSQNTPCVNWRLTLSTTGTLSATVTFYTSPDNITFTAVPNTVCSSTVQPPCVLQGANPIVGTQGMLYSASYGSYVQVVVTLPSGAGTGTVRAYGAKGASASGGGGGASGGGGPGLPIDIQCSGDVTAALAAALAAQNTAGGGTIRLSAGACSSTAQIAIPNDGTSSPIPKAHPFAILGAGEFPAFLTPTVGAGPACYGGTVLDLQYSGAHGKIYQTGEGKLELGNACLIDSTGNTTPWVEFAAGQPYIHDVIFQDVATKAANNGGTPDRTAIVLNGLGSGVIERNTFDRVKTHVWVQTSNSVRIAENYGTTNSGSTAASAAYILDKFGSGNQCFGIKLDHNATEMVNRVYGVMLKGATTNYLMENVFEDAGGGTLFDVNLDATSSGNMISGLNCANITDANGQNAAWIADPLVAYGLRVCSTAAASKALHVVGGGSYALVADETTGPAVTGNATTGKGVVGSATGAGGVGVYGSSTSTGAG